jgi:hypothetical protein
VVFCEGEQVRHLSGAGDVSSWSIATIASDADAFDDCSPALAVAPSGALHVVYRGEDGRPVYRERSTSVDAWAGGPIDGTRPATTILSNSIALEIEPGGEVDVFYLTYQAEPSVEYGMRVAHRDAEGAWTDALFEGTDSTDPERQPTPIGVPDAAWHDGGLFLAYLMRLDTTSYQVMVARRDAEGAWTSDEVTRTAGVGWWKLESAAGSLHLAFTYAEFDEEFVPEITERDMFLTDSGWRQSVVIENEERPSRWDSALDARGNNHFVLSAEREDAVYHRWRDGAEDEWSEERVALDSAFDVRAAIAADRLHVIYRPRSSDGETPMIRYVTRCLQ